ncbi:hypothetical protein Vafri_15086, partial [Volvox africanus]
SSVIASLYSKERSVLMMTTHAIRAHSFSPSSSQSIFHQQPAAGCERARHTKKCNTRPYIHTARTSVSPAGLCHRSWIKDGRMDRWTDGQMDERTDGRTDGRTVGQMDERTDWLSDGRTDGRTVGRTDRSSRILIDITI